MHQEESLIVELVGVHHQVSDVDVATFPCLQLINKIASSSHWLNVCVTQPEQGSMLGTAQQQQ